MKLLFAVALSWASWMPMSCEAGFGKLDLSPQVNPVFVRELHDGNWLAGYAKPDLWTYNLGHKYAKNLHLGVFHAWRTAGGDAAVGMNFGVGLPDLGPAIASIGNALGLDGTAKWLSLVGGSVSFDFFGGYRPIHGPDVHDYIYGFGGYLTHKFGLPDLVKGY